MKNKMGARLKKNPTRFFELFSEIGIPSNLNDAPWISWKYPHHFKNEEILKSVQEFSYPCEFNNNAVQHFSFVLTNVDSQWTFGFCRHAPETSICYVILSFLPWHEVFFKILNLIAELSNKEKTTEAKNLHMFLENLYKVTIPEPGLELHINYGEKEDFVAVCPDHEKLPSIPENRNITEYFNAIDAHNMMTIFASMLHERRILITSKNLCRLSACAQAANSLIYPMHWQHIFIPVLPKHLLDYLSAPMPFLIGVPSSTFTRMKPADMGDIVWLDADENKIDSPFADLDALPSEILQCLRQELRRPQELLGDGVARAFLRALVKLIGGYWNALRLKQGEKITFSAELFVETRPSAMQPFLHKMLELQIFQQFIDCRLKRLNSGAGVSDEFEFELTSHEDKASFRLRNQYREWVSNMKKEGGAFFKSVKTKVKNTGRRAYKDIRSKIHDIHNQKDETSYNQKRRGSVPTSLSNGFDKNPRKHHNKSSQKKEALILSLSKESQNQYSTLDEAEDSQSHSAEVRRSSVESPQLTFQPLDMDLMGDLHEVIYRSCSLGTNNSLQLIDLSSDVKKGQSSSSTRDAPPPPLLPRPPSTRGDKTLPRSSSETSSTSPHQNNQLIALEPSGSGDLFFVPSSSQDHLFQQNLLLSPSAIQDARVSLKPTNPFYNESMSNSSHIYKSSSGPNVRSMINMWQASSSAIDHSHHPSSKTMEGKADSFFCGTPYRSQPLSRTVSTPPLGFSQTMSMSPPGFSRTQDGHFASTNPFVVANESKTVETSKDSGMSGPHLSKSFWENFH